MALADFNLVARHGGFGRAARAAGRPKATLSRRVAELESSLDLRLFERGARALKLTQEGRALYERTGRIADRARRDRGSHRFRWGQAAGQVADQRAFAVLADRDGKARRRVRAEISGGPARGHDRRPGRRHDRGRL